MNEEKRPGGLTALAVLNLVFAGWGFLSLLAFGAFLALRDRIPTDNMDDTQRAQMEALQEMSLSAFGIIIALSVVANVLLLVAGIGYLKQKRILGRMVGNGYAIVSIISSVVSARMFTAEMGGGVNIATLIGLIYPVVTLILLNTTFRDDLTN